MTLIFAKGWEYLMALGLVLSCGALLETQTLKDLSEIRNNRIRPVKFHNAAICNHYLWPSQNLAEVHFCQSGLWSFRAFLRALYGHIYKEEQQLTKEGKHELGVTLWIMMHVVCYLLGRMQSIKCKCLFYLEGLFLTEEQSAVECEQISAACDKVTGPWISMKDLL